MKKIARITSVIALILAVVMCFSGCGLVDFTRSLVSKEPEAVTGSITTQPQTDAPTQQHAAPPTTQAPVATTAKPIVTSQQTTVPTTQAPIQVETEVSSTEPTTAERTTNGIGEREDNVKDIQDLLFTNDPNKATEILTAAGFEYDEEQGIFYSSMNPLQRKFGFNVVYDMAAPMAGMIYDTQRIEFEYNDKEWMVQLWKGQYGITAGAEIGLYSRSKDKVMQYDCADDEELIEMQFDFYNMGEYVFSRGPEKHWWLTGFKVFHMGIPATTTMDITLKFTDNTMATAFLYALKEAQSKAILNPIRYKRAGSRIRIIWGPLPEGLELK